MIQVIVNNNTKSPVTMDRTAKKATQVSFLVVDQAPGVSTSVIIGVGWVQSQLLKLFMREDKWYGPQMSLEHTMRRSRHVFFADCVLHKMFFSSRKKKEEVVVF